MAKAKPEKQDAPQDDGKASDEGVEVIVRDCNGNPRQRVRAPSVDEARGRASEIVKRLEKEKPEFVPFTIEEPGE